MTKTLKPYEPKEKKISICPICQERFPEDKIFAHLCEHMKLQKDLLERSEIVARWYKCVTYVKNQHAQRETVK